MTPLRDVERARDLVKHGCITERRSCLSKVSFPNRNDAKHAAKAVANKTGRETFIYACSFCRGFHVTKAKHGEEITNTHRDVCSGSESRRRVS